MDGRQPEGIRKLLLAKGKFKGMVFRKPALAHAHVQCVDKPGDPLLRPSTPPEMQLIAARSFVGKRFTDDRKKRGMTDCGRLQIRAQEFAAGNRRHSLYDASAARFEQIIDRSRVAGDQ